MPVICYVAPSVTATLEHQIKRAQLVVGRPDWVRVDKPKKKDGPVPRDERDFVIRDLLRGGDVLWVYSLDVLGDTRAEILAIFRALHGLEIPLISEVDGMNGDMKAVAYAIALERALTRAEKRCTERNALRFPRRRATKEQKTGGRPKALRESDIAEAATMKEEGKTWPEIAAVFAERRIPVKPETIMRHVKAWRARN